MWLATTLPAIVRKQAALPPARRRGRAKTDLRHSNLVPQVAEVVVSHAASANADATRQIERIVPPIFARGERLEST